MNNDKAEALTKLFEKYPSEQASTKAYLITERIKLRLKRTAEDIICIGQDLIELKAELGHGAFLPWIEREFEMSDMTAKRFMQCAQRFGDKSNKLFDFKPSILYALAAPSTPDELVEQVLEKSEQGEKVTLKEIEKLKAELKAKEKELAQSKSNFQRMADTAEEFEQMLNQTEEALEKTKAEMGKKIESRVQIMLNIELDKLAKQHQAALDKLNTEKEKLEDSQKKAIDKLKKQLEEAKVNPDPDTQMKINALKNEQSLLSDQLEEVKKKLTKTQTEHELRISNAHAVQVFADGFQNWLSRNPKAIAAIASGMVGDYGLAEMEVLANSLETFAGQIRSAVMEARAISAHQVENQPMRTIEAVAN